MATTKTKTEKIIEDITYASSNQSISRRVIYEFKNLKVMLELKSDSYRGQCYARASVLDNLEWQIMTKSFRSSHFCMCYLFYSTCRNENSGRTLSLSSIQRH